jgi:hypothetical protein
MFSALISGIAIVHTTGMPVVYSVELGNGGWRLIRKLYRADPLTYPKCGRSLLIIRFIDNLLRHQ